MPSREKFLRSNFELKKACNDMICAVRENPDAFKRLAYIEPSIRKPLPSSYRHLGIIAMIGAALAKIGFH